MLREKPINLFSERENALERLQVKFLSISFKCLLITSKTFLCSYLYRIGRIINSSSFNINICSPLIRNNFVVVQLLFTSQQIHTLEINSKKLKCKNKLKNTFSYMQWIMNSMVKPKQHAWRHWHGTGGMSEVQIPFQHTKKRSKEMVKKKKKKKKAITSNQGQYSFKMITWVSNS